MYVHTVLSFISDSRVPVCSHVATPSLFVGSEEVQVVNLIFIVHVLHSGMKCGVDWYVHLIFNNVIKVDFVNIRVELHFNKIGMLITNDPD